MSFEKWCEQHNFSFEDITLYYKSSEKNSVISSKTFMAYFDEAKDELVRLGFTSEEAKKILIINRSNVMIKEKYEKRIKVLKTLFNNNSSNNINITSIYLKYSSKTLTTRINLLKLNKFSQEEIIILLRNNDRFLLHTCDEINSCIKLFKNYDVPNNKIKRLFINNSCKIFSLKQDDFNKTIDLLINIGFNISEINNIIKNFPKILIIEKDVIKNVFKLFEDYILSKEDTITFFINKPNTFDYNEEVYNQMKDELILLGLNENNIKNVTLNANEIVTYKNNKVHLIKSKLKDLGFENEEIKLIIIGHPKILYHNSKKIEEIYKILKNNNLTKDQITDIFLNYPRIIESKCNSLDNKIKLLHRLDILELTILHPKNLIQGCEKTYLRYLYVFNILEEEITDKNIGLIYASSIKKVPQINILRTYFSYKDDMENTYEKRLEKKEKDNVKIKCYGGY